MNPPPLHGSGLRHSGRASAKSLALRDRFVGSAGPSVMVTQGGGDARVAARRRMLMAGLRMVAMAQGRWQPVADPPAVPGDVPCPRCCFRPGTAQSYSAINRTLPTP